MTGTVDQELLGRNEYLAAENRILKAQLKGRPDLSDAERGVLGEIAHRLGRKVLADIATIARPDTILGWYRKLVARKFDGSKARRYPGRPRIRREVEQLIIRMAGKTGTGATTGSRGRWPAIGWAPALLSSRGGGMVRWSDKLFGRTSCLRRHCVVNGVWVAPVPGHQLIDLLGGMTGDAGEDVGQPGHGISLREQLSHELSQFRRPHA